MALNATSVGVGRRNRFFLCMCSRNCISVIISVDIVFPIVMVMCQNCQVMVISFGYCWYRRGGGGGYPQSPDCWSSCNVRGKVDAGGWCASV